jgi:hypothetical protein
VSTHAKAPRGRPPKKTPTTIKRILEVLRLGLPIHFAAKAGDVSTETLSLWREKDPQFARDFEAARLEAVERRWRRIEKAAKGTAEHPPDWKADAWSLERVYPHLFGRPDLQLSVNQSVSTGPTNVVVLGPERAKILTTRYEQIRGRTKELFDKVGRSEPAPVRELGDGNGQSAQTSSRPEPESPNNAPELPDKCSSWWARFIFPGAPIPKADATVALGTILSHLRIAVDEATLDFKTDYVTQATFSKVLEQLSGSNVGWRSLVELYERELERERHRVNH